MTRKSLVRLLFGVVGEYHDERTKRLFSSPAVVLVRLTRRLVYSLERSMRTWFYRYRYGDAAPRPHELISADPDEINHLLYPNVHNYSRHVNIHNAYVEDGDWDRNYHDETVFTRRADELRVTELDNWVFYRSLLDHFENGVEWASTEWYRRIASRGGLHDQVDYGTVERMEERLAKVDALYEFIDEHGYKTQAELVEDQRAPFEAVRHPRPEHHEVVVNVGRDGRLLFEEGRHRLAVAKALDLDRIPVRVLVRHERWQALRHRVATAADPSDLCEEVAARLDHPDVRTVVPEGFSPPGCGPDESPEALP